MFVSPHPSHFSTRRPSLWPGLKYARALLFFLNNRKLHIVYWSHSLDLHEHVVVWVGGNLTINIIIIIIYTYLEKKNPQYLLCPLYYVFS